MRRIILFLIFTISLHGYIIKHNYYTLDYSEFHRQAKWVSYILTDNFGKVKRKNNFRKDPMVINNPVGPKDYSRTGYDRGHLAPAGDFTFSKLAMSESFYMSNMSPQLPRFNRGIWKKLESKVRIWVKKYKKLNIVVGGVLTGVNESINGITVPSLFFKLIYDNKRKKSIGFLMKNEGSKKDLKYFVVSVNEVEEITGIDFFENNERVESQKNYNEWR